MSDGEEKPKTSKASTAEELAVWRLTSADRARLKLAYANQLRASNWLLFKSLVVGTVAGSAYYGWVEKGEGWPSSIAVFALVALVLTMIFREFQANKHVKCLSMAGEMAVLSCGIEYRGPDGVVWQHRPSPGVRTFWKILRINRASSEFLYNEVWAGDESPYETSRPVLVPIPEGVDLQQAIELLNTYNAKALALAKA